jgi:RNA polymerase sigma factor (sigma-70 family)
MDSFVLIVNQAKAGDSAAFEELVRRFQDMAVSYAYGVLGDPHSAQDAVQEAFIAAYMDLSQLRVPEAFPSWFRKVIYKQCDRLTRGENILTVPLTEADPIGSSQPTPDQLAVEADIAQRVREEIARLPEAERAVTELFYIGEHSQQEVAEKLNVSVATVKNRLQSSRNYLRERMFIMADEALAEERAALTMSQMIPLLTVYDVRRSIQFYRDILGFEVEGTIETKGPLGFAALRRDDIRLMFNSALEPSEQDPKEDKSRSMDVTFYFWSMDVANLRDRLIQEGLDVGDLHETYYGMRQFALHDPDGYNLVLQEPTQGTSVPGAKSSTA